MEEGQERSRNVWAERMDRQEWNRNAEVDSEDGQKTNTKTTSAREKRQVEIEARSNKRHVRNKDAGMYRHWNGLLFVWVRGFTCLQWLSLSELSECALSINQICTCFGIALDVICQILPIYYSCTWMKVCCVCVFVCISIENSLNSHYF